MRICNLKANKENCNCSYEPCSRKGICCECLRYHFSKGQLPACFFPPDAEKTYNRNIENFIQLYKERGRWW